MSYRNGKSKSGWGCLFALLLGLLSLGDGYLGAIILLILLAPILLFFAWLKELLIQNWIPLALVVGLVMITGSFVYLVTGTLRDERKR